MASINISEGPYIFHYRPTVGDTLTRTITFYEGTPAVLLDVSGDTFRMVVEDQATKALVNELELLTGIEFEDDNTIRWTITDAQTGAWTPPAQMTYAIIWTKADGTVRTIQAGNITPQKYYTN